MKTLFTHFDCHRRAFKKNKITFNILLHLPRLKNRGGNKSGAAFRMFC